MGGEECFTYTIALGTSGKHGIRDIAIHLRSARQPLRKLLQRSVSASHTSHELFCPTVNTKSQYTFSRSTSNALGPPKLGPIGI